MSQTELRYEQSPLKIDYSQKNLVRMNLNENLVFPQNVLRLLVAKCADRFEPRYYPSDLGEGELQKLASEIARYCGCSSSSVGIGVGSDQLIDLVIRMKLGGSTGKLLTVDPTFSMYAILARRMGSKVLTAPVNKSTGKEPFSLPVEKLLSVCREKSANLLVLASPNNPTGIQYPVEQIKQVAESIPAKTTFLLDEAYVEFGQYNAAKTILRSYQNLVILRTFSKAFALASLRLGYLLSSNSEFIERFNNDFQYPFPVSSFSVNLAIDMLKRCSVVLEHAGKTKQLRAELIESLQKLKGGKLRVVPKSDANFVVVQSKDARRIAEELLSKYAIALKYIPRMEVESEFLRITVGSRELNQRLLYALRRILA